MKGEKHEYDEFLTAEEWEVKTERKEEKEREEKGMWEVRRERMQERGGDRGRPRQGETGKG